MKRNLTRVVVMLAVIGIAIVAAGAIIKARSGKEGKEEIKTAKVERADVKSTVSATGILQPLTLVDVKSNVGGKIEVLKVDVGDMVKKGQLIATVDPTDSQTAFDQAKANTDRDYAKLAQSEQNLELQRRQSEDQIAQANQQLLSAQAKLRQAKNTFDSQPGLTRASIEQAEANLAAAQQSYTQLKDATIPQAKMQAQANLSQAKSNMDTAKRNLDRQKALLDRGFVPASTMDTAQSQYDTAKATYDTSQRKSETVDMEYKAALSAEEARVAQAKAQLKTAQRNSVQDMLKKDELAAARAAVDEAKASVRLAIANKHQIEVKHGDVVQARAAIVSTKAAYDQAKQNLSYCTITSPRDGIVLVKYVEQGTIIASGKSSVVQGTNIVQLGDVSKMFVVCQVDETDIAGVEVGQKVDITVDAYPNEVFDGKVTRVDPQAKVTQNVTTIPVTVEIDNPDARLKSTMNASCEFITAKHENVVAVPNEAIHEDNGQSSVLVLQGTKRVKRNVEVGIAGSDSTEIKSGLKEGEVVITQIIVPEKPGANTANTQQRSPFGSPFGGPPQRGGGGGGRGGR